MFAGANRPSLVIMEAPSAEIVDSLCLFEDASLGLKERKQDFQEVKEDCCSFSEIIRSCRHS